MPNEQRQHKKHLPRLDAANYRGQAYVHWTLSIEDRRRGWLAAAFHFQFRELLTHAAFRYSFCCPVYCLMPDHMHLLWIGIDDGADQLKAMKFLRQNLGNVLDTLGFKLQHQSYDHVLRDDERQETALENTIEYIARNPERQELVPIDGFQAYKYTGCLLPGYPEMSLWDVEFWPRFWRAYSFVGRNGLIRRAHEVVDRS